MRSAIRKTSTTPNAGGLDVKIDSYDEIIKDHEALEEMKEKLGIEGDIHEISNGDENDQIVNGKPKWAGKTLFELLKSTNNDKNNGQQDLPNKTEQVLTVQHCQLDHVTPNLEDKYPSQSLEDKKETSVISRIVQDQTSFSLRCLERLDSSDENVNQDNQDKGNHDLQDWLNDNPAVLVICYFLALMHNLGGLDFLSLLGVVMATISMVSMFFI